ncbi:host attachment protein [Roseobacter sinensis]|uniref:Host attachment protein n=1 Tax=Roseobacter sinensis TaxID=2931391 RepID=A0ABT3BD38_9RHOB|nr:host attachment protein [Roseobacter sp. WL0113]MCV3271496.1 host attachment protein [Roseobacter sp. WL0113]
MKPIVTWIVLANAREARVLANRGPGSGLAPVPGQCWTAEDPDPPRDRAGVGHSIAGPAVSAVAQTDPHRRSSALFARKVMCALSGALAAEEFDRLVIVAGPLMLGLMRKAMDHRLKYTLIGEIDKDLSALPIAALATHLGDVMAV